MGCIGRFRGPAHHQEDGADGLLPSAKEIWSHHFGVTDWLSATMHDLDDAAPVSGCTHMQVETLDSQLAERPHEDDEL